MRFLLVLFLFYNSVCCYAGKTESSSVRLNILNSWMEEYFDMTKNCVGYTPPVAARTFSYLTIGSYEALVESDTTYLSLSNQLVGFQRSVWLNKDEKVSFSHVLNVLNWELCNYYFENMPPSNLEKINQLFKENEKLYANRYNHKILNASELYAKKLANEIIEWSKTDNGDKAYNSNYPTSYIPPVGPSFWVQTYPGYRKALLPYWGENRLLVEEDTISNSNFQALEYSSDTNSIIYRDAKSLVDLYKSFTKEQEVIAEFWNDAPGYSGTPSGHIFSIGLQLSKKEKFDVLKSAHFYSLLGICLNDAFIVCWKLKYEYNLLRPITYIQKHITPEYTSHIASPPFPEFPSGHSLQSGSVLPVFIYFFTDNFVFTDSTHVLRVDIDGSPRKFESFSEMNREISISRFYGGIHFPYTLEISSELGEILGKGILQKIRYKK